jgi:hypothetical protein
MKKYLPRNDDSLPPREGTISFRGARCEVRHSFFQKANVSVPLLY